MKRSDFKLESELKGMKVADIKKHVRAFNKHYAIQGYSKLKKTELVSAILSAQMRLGGAKKTKKKLLVVEAPKKAPVAKAASLSPREVFMRGDFTNEYKKGKGEMAFTNTPLFKVGDSVSVNYTPTSTRRQAAKIVALGKTITIKFDENDSNVTDKRERGGTKRFIKYSNVVSPDKDIVEGDRGVMLPYGGSEIV